MKLRTIVAVLLAVFPPCFALTGCSGDVTASPKAGVSGKPSYFESDDDGVLWFQKGSDRKTDQRAALELSAVKDGIVILVAADESLIGKSVEMAIKMRSAMLKAKGAPAEIDIVAYRIDAEGVGYEFYFDGMGYSYELSELGVYGPKEAKEHLGRVIGSYLILREKAAKGEWGVDHAKIRPIEIVKR